MCALVTGVQTCALPIWRSDYRPKNDKTPVCISRQGSWEFNLDDDLLSHGETPHYHRRCIVSLLSSGWDQVVPMLYGRQEIRVLSRGQLASLQQIGYAIGLCAVRPFGSFRLHTPQSGQIGRASCRDRVCQYVKISVVAVSLKKK